MADPRGKAVVVGAGLGGALMAVNLARAGFQVEVLERRSDPRRTGRPEGRSINLAISTRGLHALDQVGLKDKVLARAVPMRGRMMHAVSGELTFQPYGTEAGHTINSVSRAGLNQMLIEAAEAMPGVSVRFGQRTVAVDLDAGIAHAEDVATGAATEARGDVVIGADGAFSAVRGQMQKLDRFDYSQSYLDHGYKELSIPPRPDGDFALEPNALHIWPRGGFMMIALPNPDRSFTCTLFYPNEGKDSFASLATPGAVHRFFNQVFPDAVPLMPELAEDFFGNPTGSLVTVRCRPWHHGRTVLLGDAAHAVVPFYGQGANCAFEDCVALDECVRASAPDWARVFADFQARRKVNADALADLAVANFYEMRDHVASRLFLARKKMEKMLARLFPRWYVPLYTMVSFSRTPYAEAVRRARAQDHALAWGAGGLAAVLLIAMGGLWWLTRS